MANSLVFNYVDAAKKQSIEKAIAYIDAIKDATVIAYDDTNIRGELRDVSAFVHAIHIPERVGELANDTNYLVPDDISSFITEEELESKGYLTDHQSLDAYAKTSDINIHLSNIDASVEAALELEREDVSAKIAEFRSDFDTGLTNVETYINNQISALDTSLSAVIASNKTTASNDLEYAITRVRGDFDVSLNIVVESKQDAFIVGNGLALQDGILSTTIDTTLFRIVDELPTEDILDNKIYLISTHNSTVGDVYTEHIHTAAGWEKLGEFKATTDLSGYYTKDEVDATFLSTRNALEGIISSNQANNNLKFVEIDGSIGALNTADLNLQISIDEKSQQNAQAIQALQGTVADHKVITDANANAINDLDASVEGIYTKESEDFGSLSSLIVDLNSDVVNVTQKANNLDASIAAEIGDRQDAIVTLKDQIDASISAIEDEITGIEIPSLDGYATEQYVDEQIAAIPAPDFSPYATKEAVDASIAAIEIPSIDGLATEVYVDEQIAAIPETDLSGYALKADVDASIAAIEIPSIDGLATETYVNNAIAAIPAPDFSPYATKEAVDASINAIEIPSLDGYATEEYVGQAIESIPETDLSGYALKADVDASINAIEIPSLDGYATEQYVDNKVLEIEIPSLDGYATETYVDEKISEIPAPDLSGYALKADVDASISAIEIPSLADYATEQYVGEQIAAIPAPDLSGYALKADVDASINAIEIPSLDGYATEEYVGQQIEAIPDPDLSDYVTKEEVGELGNAQEAAPAHGEYWTFLGEQYDEDPTFEESTDYDYIYDEASWNESFANGALKKYYAKYPDEDRYNTQAHRWAWEADKVNGEWPDYCIQCWEGAINADGAKFPWVCANFETDVHAKIIYQYEGLDDVMPWGDNLFGVGVKADGTDRMWGIASVAEEFQNNSFLIPEGDGEHEAQHYNSNDSWSGTAGDQNFDITKFKMILVHQDVEHVEAEDAKEEIAHTVKSYADAKYADLLEKYNALLARVVALEEGQN